MILGAIFDINNAEAEIAFKHAVIRENIANFNKFNLVPIVKNIDTTNTFEAEQTGELKFKIFRSLQTNKCHMLSSTICLVFYP